MSTAVLSVVEDDDIDVEDICDVFAGVTNWEFRHAEDPYSSDTGKFYRVIVRADGRKDGFAQYGRRPYGSNFEFQDAPGTQENRYDAKKINSLWRSKLRKSYSEVIVFKFRAPTDGDWNTIAGRAIAALRDPELRVEG